MPFVTFKQCEHFLLIFSTVMLVTSIYILVTCIQLYHLCFYNMFLINCYSGTLQPCFVSTTCNAMNRGANYLFTELVELKDY